MGNGGARDHFMQSRVRWIRKGLGTFYGVILMPLKADKMRVSREERRTSAYTMVQNRKKHSKNSHLDIQSISNQASQAKGALQSKQTSDQELGLIGILIR